MVLLWFHVTIFVLFGFFGFSVVLLGFQNCARFFVQRDNCIARRKVVEALFHVKRQSPSDCITTQTNTLTPQTPPDSFKLPAPKDDLEVRCLETRSLGCLSTLFRITMTTFILTVALVRCDRQSQISAWI